MHLEAVIVSVNYGDILAHTLPQNHKFFNKLVVVTTEEDELTQELCTEYHVKCIITDKLYKNGSKFNKGAVINEGLKELTMKDWVLHLDADIWLPAYFKRILKKTQPHPSTLYGVDRLMCESTEGWREFLNNPITRTGNWMLNMTRFPMGTRLVYHGGKMWTPLGFFQLWNPEGSKIFDYPESNGADQSDIMFAEKWPRALRALIPEILVYHLENQESETGINWYGRKTPPFRI